MYHGTDSVLEQVNRVQRRFLREAGLTEKDALLTYNLAPLQARRDMAMLGLIHRTVLQEGPPVFQLWFFPCTQAQHSYNTRQTGRLHSKQLHNYLQGRYTEQLRRSPLGLTRVYNQLPQEAVDKTSVKAFQRWLQNHMKKLAEAENGNWQKCFNLRRTSWKQRKE